MANTTPIFGLTPNLSEVTFTSSDTTTPKSIWSAGANGSKLLSICAASDDTAAINVKLYIYDGTTSYRIGTVNVPIGAGQDGIEPSVNLLDSAQLPVLDALGELALPTGYSIYAGCLATMTAAKTLTLVTFGVDF